MESVEAVRQPLPGYRHDSVIAYRLACGRRNYAERWSAHHRYAYKKSDDTLVVELSPGNMLLLNQQEVKLHKQNAKGEAAYAEALKLSSDTIESHMQMAGVARKSELPDHEKAHYERIIELDSEHAVARAALGYVKNTDGRWILRDEQMRDGRGKVSIGGNRYRFPELLAMQKAEEKFTVERAQLANEIKRALNNLSNPRNSAKAQATLDGLNGPMASAAVAYMLYPKPNPLTKSSVNPATKLLFVPILERLGDGTAIQTLIRMCLETEGGVEQAKVRQQALAAVKKLDVEAAYHGFMAALTSGNNATINLAGELLKELGDERAVLPLIERVFTVERRKYGGSQATNVGMSNGGMSFSKGDPEIIRNETMENPGVLGALVAITGQNFSYDKAAWLAWYEQNYTSFNGDLRRDQ